MYISISREKQNKFIYLGRLWLSKSSIVQITSLSKKYLKNDQMNECTSTKCDLKFSKLLAWSTTKKPVYLGYGMYFLCIFYHVTWVFPHCLVLQFRAVGRSENLGVPVLFGGHNLPPLVEIGLTDLPKFGGASTPGTPRDDRPEQSTAVQWKEGRASLVHQVASTYDITWIQANVVRCFEKVLRNYAVFKSRGEKGGNLF